MASPTRAMFSRHSASGIPFWTSRRPGHNSFGGTRDPVTFPIAIRAAKSALQALCTVTDEALCRFYMVPQMKFALSTQAYVLLSNWFFSECRGSWLTQAFDFKTYTLLINRSYCKRKLGTFAKNPIQFNVSGQGRLLPFAYLLAAGLLHLWPLIG